MPQWVRRLRLQLGCFLPFSSLRLARPPREETQERPMVVLGQHMIRQPIFNERLKIPNLETLQ
eukprot:2946559-Amphidinium_carterae.1